MTPSPDESGFQPTHEYCHDRNVDFSPSSRPAAEDGLVRPSIRNVVPGLATTPAADPKSAQGTIKTPVA